MNRPDQEAVERLIEQGEPDEAARICAFNLNDDPDDGMALYYLGRCQSLAGRFGVSAVLYKRVTEIYPEDSASWNNLGFSYHSINRLSEAEGCFERAIHLDHNNWPALNNMAALYAARVRPHEAIETGLKALEVAATDSDRSATLETLAMPYLGLKEWDKGWKAYEHGLPGKYRRERQYAGEPRWEGKPGGKVVFYGEQGIGDEIMFASILPDVEDVDVVIECDRRLEGLFKRTFPHAEVHGTRFDKHIDWANGITGRCAFGSLGKFYRRTAESFPRQPYLKACPLRRKMYRSLLDILPGRKIGIAWTGGTKTTRTDIRSLRIGDVERFAANHPEISFISLEYKDTGTAKGIHSFPFITRTNDYDDTAALVAELDGVISVTTAVALLAGAVGTKCDVLVPTEPTWHWGYEGEMPWFPIDLHRGNWDLESLLMRQAA